MLIKTLINKTFFEIDLEKELCQERYERAAQINL